jgi:uncharacterized membrane protein YuzA (DUF378 family)
MDVSRWKTWRPREGTCRAIDVIAYVLLILGALGWGLVGFVGYEVLSSLFDRMAVLMRLFCGLVGIAALYELLSWPWIARRWEIHIHRQPAHA